MNKREQLKKLVKELEAFADELDAKGEASAEDVGKLNQMGTDIVSLKESIVAEATAAGTVDMAKAFLADLAGPADPTPTTNDIDVRNGVVNPKGMTLGEAFAKSPAYEEFINQYKGADGRIREVTNLKSASFDLPSLRTKALITGADDASAGATVQPYRYAPITDLVGDREVAIRDLCTNVSIQSDTFEFVQVTAKVNNAAAVAEAANSNDPAGTAPGGGGAVTYAPASGVKPESSLTLGVVSAPVETIAHLMPITRRAAADAPQVRQLVDAFLRTGLQEEEEDQILNGNGTSPNLRGILQTAGISTVGSPGTDIDAVVAAVGQIRADRRKPTAIVVHPNDWYSTGFLLAKDSQGRYLLGDPRASIEQLNTLWGLRVVVTEAMTENTALVGDFTQAVVADREQSAVYVTDSHKDWFARNLLAILAEERLALGVLDPDAFCTVTAI
jgi:HK97 family phage major capsid protein